jgi:16S rRNA processing protein RimM
MDNERVALGRIGKAHGIKGGFRVWPYAGDHERFGDLKQVTLHYRERTMTVDVTEVRNGNGFVILWTSQFETPEDVRPWIGGDLEVEASERITLPPGQYFHDQIIGLKVRTTEGREIGEIVDVIDGPANDVYVCHDGTRETLIPAVGQFVREIDIEAGTMTIATIPGLLGDDEEPVR